MMAETSMRTTTPPEEELTARSYRIPARRFKRVGSGAFDHDERRLATARRDVAELGRRESHEGTVGFAVEEEWVEVDEHVDHPRLRCGEGGNWLSACGD